MDHEFTSAADNSHIRILSRLMDARQASTKAIFVNIRHRTRGVSTSSRKNTGEIVGGSNDVKKPDCERLLLAYRLG